MIEALLTLLTAPFVVLLIILSVGACIVAHHDTKPRRKP